MTQCEFVSLLTLQAAEGQEEPCFELIKIAFDDPSVLSAEYYSSAEDPEILMALIRWPSQGAFEEHMRRIEDFELFKNTQKRVDFTQITHWNPQADS